MATESTDQPSGLLSKFFRLLNGPSRSQKWLRIAMGVFLAAFVVGVGIFGFEKSSSDQPYWVWVNDLKDQKVSVVKISSGFILETANIELKDGTTYNVSMPHMDQEFAEKLANQGIQVKFEKPSTDYSRYVTTAVMLLILIALLSTMAPSLSSFRIGKTKSSSNIKFSQVAGAQEAKHALEDVVSYLKDSKKFESLGARFPKGIIMYGEPGTGKTLLAKAVAGEAEANFISVSGSDFGSPFVGISSKKIRNVFAQARRMAPCVLFIDEIDAIGGRRMNEGSSVAREMGNILNQILVEMDGFDTVPGLIVIAATNRLELLDPALLRSGRFDRRIHMPAPNLEERHEILRIHAEKMLISTKFDFRALARASVGMSGADLSNIMNQAAMLAAKAESKVIETEHALQARDLILMGEARPSVSEVFDHRTRQLLAAHEAGHAVVGLIKGPDPVTRISIIPRGPSLGSTFMSPLKERFVYEKSYLESQIMVLLGGRAAEQMAMNTATTGASDDLMRASRIARDMVGKYGMTDAGLKVIGETASTDLASKAEEMIDSLLKRFMNESMAILIENRLLFDDICAALIDHEEVNEQEILELLKRHNVPAKHEILS